MKNKKYIWLPAVLLIYTAVLAWWNRDSVTVRHEYWQFYGTLGVELVVIVTLFFFLRWRQRLSDARKQDEKQYQNNE